MLETFKVFVSRVIFVTVVWLLLVRDSLQGPHEDRLIEYLLTNNSYQPLSRPVPKEDMAVEVVFGLSLQQIVGVDEKNEMLHTNIWLDYKWADYKMVWNPADFGYINSIRLPFKSVWTPDILLYNSADEDIDSKYPVNVVVNYNGEMTWIPLGIFISTCTMNILWFPFDIQNCTLKFGSWTYDSSKINLTLKYPYIVSDSYSESGEWEILEKRAVRNEIKYDCCPEIYPDITFVLVIRRRTLYHGVNLIIPCVLVSILGLLTFTLPPDAGEKITLSITVLLQLGVMSLIVADMVPPTSNHTPLIGVYFSGLMFMCTLSVVLSVVVLNFHHRNPNMHQMPLFVKYIICEWLAWFLRMSRRNHDLSFEHIKRKSRMRQLKERLPPSLSLISNIRDLDNLIPIHQSQTTDQLLPANNHQQSSPLPNHHQQPAAGSAGNHQTPLPPLFRNGLDDSLNQSSASMMGTYGMGSVRTELQGILNELRYLTGRMKEDEEEKEEVLDWKFAGMVIDRLCFWVLSFVLVGITIGIFIAPHISELISKKS